MRWTLRKFDALLGTIVAALTGLIVAQLPAFMQQYLQRLGGHVDEATLSLSRIATDTTLRTLEPPARQALAASLEQRVGELQSGQQAIASASAVSRPFIFFRELDVDIALATLRVFEPALPLSSAGLIYGLSGMVAGWVLYELLKAPLGMPFRRRPHHTPVRTEPY